MSGTETITVELPVAAVRRLQRVASVAQRPIDEIMAQALDAGLPPQLTEIPAEFQADLTALEQLPSETLRQVVFADLDADSQGRYAQLLTDNQAGSVDELGRRELARLRAEADRLMFRRAYAALLLKWRGQAVPGISVDGSFP